MKTLLDHLSNYADYHRSVRNITTHLIGVPMIVLAVIALLSRPVWMVSTVSLSPALIIAAITLLYYLKLDLKLGAIMVLLFGLGLGFGAWAASLSTTLWLSISIGSFLVGWVIQFIGHYFEGRKPAFFDDILGLLIGPLFVVAELLFKLGLFKELEQKIEERSGPTRA